MWHGAKQGVVGHQEIYFIILILMKNNNANIFILLYNKNQFENVKTKFLFPMDKEDYTKIIN